MKEKKLAGHIYKSGEFITLFNSYPHLKLTSDDESWIYGRMPEYIWIGLILEYYGRDDGLSISYYIIRFLNKLAPLLKSPRISQILKLDEKDQKRLYDYIILLGAKKAICPLTVILTESKYPVFCESFYMEEFTVKDRSDALKRTMEKIMDHQSHEATDIRFVALWFHMLTGKLHISKDQIDLLSEYPKLKHNDEIMKQARPNVRSLEMLIMNSETPDTEFLHYYWGCISKMTDCELLIVKYPKETRNISKYMEKLHSVFEYLTDLYLSSNPLDEKMKVLLGIATFSYKRFKEIYDNNLFNTISGRSCVRSIAENYIMMKYLMQNENEHLDIWKDYQLYGLGKYKIILERLRENEWNSDSHFDDKYVSAIVNEFTYEDFINIDTRYFDNTNIRNKFYSVNEEELYGLYFDYDSSFEHGMWGAIRESSLLKCNNPTHKYHCVPDIYDETVLKSVLPDCVLVMNKIIELLNNIYGIPIDLYCGVVNYEIESISG